MISLGLKIKKLRFLLEYILCLALVSLIRIIPRLALQRLAGIAGALMYLFPPFGSLVRANVAAAFPDKNSPEIKKISRRSLTHLILSLLDFFWFSANSKRLNKYIELSDPVAELFARLDAKGKGVLYVTPHLGNWELAGLKFANALNFPLAVVAKPVRNPYLDRLINVQRISGGSTVVKSRGSVLEMRRLLTKGFHIAILIDQNTRVREGGVFVDFFGLPVPSSRTPALFARRMDVPVVVGGAYLQGGKYSVFARTLPLKAEEYKSDTEFIQALMSVVEDLVREHPEQYLWFYKRFQYIPRDADENLLRRYPYYAKRTEDRFYRKRKSG